MSVLMVLLLGADGATQVTVHPPTFPSSKLTIDKRPRADGDWIVWTRDAGTVESHGEVLARFVPDGTLHVLGAGFHPDVTCGPGAEVSAETARVTWLRFAADESLEVVQGLFVDGRWSMNVLAGDFGYADHLRAVHEHTVWIASDAEGLLRVVHHDGADLHLLPSTRPAARPEMARLASGELLLVWDEYTGGPGGVSYEVRLATYSAATGWSSPETLPGPVGGQEYDPFVLPTADGGAWLAWQTRRGAEFWRTFVAHRASDGTLTHPAGYPAGSPPGLVDLRAFRATYDPVLALDGGGRLWLFVSEKLLSFGDLNRALRYAIYAGDAWTDPVEVVHSPLGEDHLDVVPRPEGLRLVYEMNVPALRSQEVALQVIETSGAAEPLVLHPPGEPPPPDPPMENVALTTRRQLAAGGTTYELLFADFHCHSRQSPDAAGALDYALRYARDHVGLDAMASTDHDELLFATYQDYEYALARRLVALHDGPTFTALAGFEWTSRGAYLLGELIGHRATFDSARVYRSIDELSDELPEYYALMHAEGAIGVPHHLGKHGGATFKLHDRDIQPITEIASVHGVFEDELLSKLVNDRARFGITAAGDTHDVEPGRSGLAALWIDPAVSPRKDAIKEALRARRTYAVRRDGAFLDVRLNGRLMGSEFAHDGDLLLQYELEDVGLVPPFHVNVTRQGDYAAPVYSRVFAEGEPVVDWAVLPGVPYEAFYMLRVTAGLGTAPQQTWIWSSPFWVTPRTGPVAGGVQGKGAAGAFSGSASPSPASPSSDEEGSGPAPRLRLAPSSGRIAAGSAIALELDITGPASLDALADVVLRVRHDGGPWLLVPRADLLRLLSARAVDGGVRLVCPDLRLPRGEWTFVVSLVDARGLMAASETRLLVE